MTFGFPLGLLALGALLPLAAAYFLRRRQKPKTVSALFLWILAARPAEPDRGSGALPAIG